MSETKELKKFKVKVLRTEERIITIEVETETYSEAERQAELIIHNNNTFAKRGYVRKLRVQAEDVEETYDFTEQQEEFVALCLGAGLDVYYDYSGRHMYGRKCPAVNVDDLSEFPENTHKYKVDNMGLGYVVYCP